MNRARSATSRGGVWLAVLGPDGSGKSTLLDRIERDLSPRFGSVQRHHLRPHWGRRRPGRPTTDPHGRPPRGRVASVAKLCLWWADYWLGYLLQIRPALRGSGLVLFDRYFDDLLVDPRRYRYGGPVRLARLVAQSIPRPHAILVLDAPVDVLRERKREVSPEEVERQRWAYHQLAERLASAHEVDAGRPFEEVVADAERIVTGSLPAEARAPAGG